MRQSLPVLRMQGRQLPQPFVLNTVQARLVVAALTAAGAGDVDLLARGSYVPSAVAQAWSGALFEAVPELVLVEVWHDRRAQLRPVGVRRVPHPATDTRHRRREVVPDPFAGLPPMAERTPVLLTPLGPLLQSLAVWTGTCGGCAIT